MSDETHPMKLHSEHLVRDEGQLRDVFGDTGPMVWKKAIPFLNAPMKRFIELSPFCCIASRDNDGQLDISPRGDAPGFVTMHEDRTLLLPDRPGNRRYDTARNVLENGQVSLLFFIPGVADTLRINGRSRISRDPELLSQFVVRDREPLMVFVITIDEAFGHCSKAIKRSSIWTDDNHRTPQDSPSLLEMSTSHLNQTREEVENYREVVDRDAVDNLY